MFDKYHSIFFFQLLIIHFVKPVSWKLYPKYNYEKQKQEQETRSLVGNGSSQFSVKVTDGKRDGKEELESGSPQKPTPYPSAHAIISFLSHPNYSSSSPPSQQTLFFPSTSLSIFFPSGSWVEFITVELTWLVESPLTTTKSSSAVKRVPERVFKRVQSNPQ